MISPDRAREWLIRELAGILFASVDATADRALLDWLTAERWIDTHPYLVAWVARSPVSPWSGAVPADDSDAELTRHYAPFVWENVWQPCAFRRQLPAEYGRVTFA